MSNSLRCNVVRADVKNEYLAWDPALHGQLPAAVQRELRVVITASSAVEKSLLDYIINSLGSGESAEAMARAINNLRRQRRLQEHLWYLQTYSSHLEVRQL